MISLIWSSGDYFVGRSRTIWEILAEGKMWNISIKNFEFGQVVQEMFKIFLI